MKSTTIGNDKRNMSLAEQDGGQMVTTMYKKRDIGTRYDHLSARWTAEEVAKFRAFFAAAEKRRKEAPDAS